MEFRCLLLLVEGLRKGPDTRVRNVFTTENPYEGFERVRSTVFEKVYDHRGHDYKSIIKNYTVKRIE